MLPIAGLNTRWSYKASSRPINHLQSIDVSSQRCGPSRGQVSLRVLHRSQVDPSSAVAHVSCAAVFVSHG